MSSSANSPANFEELEHNPFAEAAPLATAALKVATNDPLASSLIADNASKTLHSAVESLSFRDKERSSSVMASKVPVDIDHSSNGYEPDLIQVTVHDPQTVGDGLKAHTIYSLTTKTTSSAFRSSQMTIQRRFKEFLWLYSQLSEHNPGVIVPPVPEKHAIGRFEEDFVENRRYHLERMMQKISRHPILSKDPVLVSFLQGDSLGHSASNSDLTQADGKKVSSGKSFLGGMFSDLNAPKMQETDDYLEQKRQYIDSFDSQLKSVAKAVDSMIKHREGLSGGLVEFGDAVTALSQAEINKASEKNLVSFAQVQRQLKDLYSKQAEYDLFYLANTVDEYARIATSVKQAFASRVKAYQNWQTSEQNLIKSRISLEKARLNIKTKPEKLQQIETEILDWESRVVSTKKEFEDITKLLKTELEAFEGEKVVDIQECIKGFLKSVVAVQQQIVQVWEEFLRDMEPINQGAISHS